MEQPNELEIELAQRRKNLLKMVGGVVKEKVKSKSWMDNWDGNLDKLPKE